MARIFSFPNLVAVTGQGFNSVVDCIRHATNAVKNADQVRGFTKQRRRDWFKADGSVWPCVSFVEGLNPVTRISGENPPHLLHGIAADFDNVNRDFTPEELVQLAGRCAFPPAAGGKSLSGNGYHFIWLFEEPIQLLGNERYATKMLKTIFSKVRAGNLMVGLDDACMRPTQLLSIDHENFGWLSERGESQIISSTATRLWASEVDSDFEFDGVALDLEAVKECVDRLFPGRWVGPFVAGARGVRFWDPSATDPTAAVVTAQGMRYFTDGGGFKTWAQILGSDFVEKISAESIKSLTDDWYYAKDSGEYIQYFRELDIYRRWTRRQFGERLLLLGLKKAEDQVRAVSYVENFRAVEAYVEVANHAHGPIYVGRDLVINVRPTTPPKVVEGPCDYLRDLICEAMFPGPQAHYFLTWLRGSVIKILEEKPSFAQAVFLVGDTNLGKSLLQQRVLTPLFGGVEANPMGVLTGKSIFNADLVRAGHWCVNDAPGAQNTAQQQDLAQHIKTITSTYTGHIHAKYHTPRQVTLNARVTFSLNRVMECLQVFPRLGDDVLDKLILLDVRNHDYFRTRPRTKAIDDIVAEELPGFAHWLLNVYTPPDWALSRNPRYYAHSYKEPDLLRYTMASQDNAELLNLIHLAHQPPEMAEYRTGAKRLEENSAGWLRVFRTVLGGNVENLTQRKITWMFTALSRQYPEAIERIYDNVARNFKFAVNYTFFTRNEIPNNTSDHH